MRALVAMWRDNPVMLKEVRARMRGARAYWIITGYLLFLSFILFMQYTVWWNQTQASGHSLASGSKIGQQFLLWLTVTQAFLVAFITPAITSGAITIEREQRTLEMLEVTRLTPGQVVVGKLTSAVGFVLLLLISSLPLASICFFLGGVSPEQIAYTYILLAAVSFVAGTLGLAWSAVARTTAAAVVLTYGSLLSPFILFLILGMLTMSQGPSSAFDAFLVNIVGLYGIPATTISGIEYSPSAAYFLYWNQVRYFGLTLPRWLPGLASLVLIGTVLAATAAARLAAIPERRAGLLRMLVVLFLVEQMFFFFGARLSAHAPGAPVVVSRYMSAVPVFIHLLYPVLLLLVLAPAFCTGEVRPSEARKLSRLLVGGWSPSGWKSGRLSSGWPYLCLLALLIVGMFALSFALVGHGADAFSGRIGSSAGLAAPTVPGAAGSLPGSFASVEQGGNLLQIAVMLLSVVTGLFFLGLFLSLAAGSRWVAMMIMYFGLSLVLVLPYLAYTASRYDASAVPSATINLFYLNPLYAILRMSDNTGGYFGSRSLMFGWAPAWSVTTIAYALIAVVSIMFSMPFVTRTAARRVLPYEETAR